MVTTFHANDDFASANPEDIKRFVNTELVIRIENALKVGKENALKMRQLKLLVRTVSERKIRLTINEMRLNGHLILSDSQRGYWYSANVQEFFF